MHDPLTPDRAAALEADFLARVRSRVEGARCFSHPATGRRIHGRARLRPEFPADFEDEARRVLFEEGLFTGEVPDRLPRGARAVFAVGGGPFGRAALLVVVAVLHPFGDLARGRPAVPLGRKAAFAALPAGEAVAAAVLSTSGWAEEPAARDGGPWLFEPAPAEGYRLAGGGGPAPAFLAPETEEDLLARACRWVEVARAELVLRGLSSRRTCGEIGVPEPLVARAFRRAAEDGEFLALSEEDGAVVLRRV